MFRQGDNLARDICRVLTAVEGTTKTIVEAETALGIATGTVNAEDLAKCIFRCTCCNYWVGSDYEWEGEICEGCVECFGKINGEYLIHPLPLDEEE